MILSAYNYDKIGKNELMGINVVQCKDVPHISSTSLLDDKTPKRCNLALPLFKVEEIQSFQELALRHQNGDTEASNFFKLLSKKYGLLTSRR